jgi:hypothetical protein
MAVEVPVGASNPALACGRYEVVKLRHFLTANVWTLSDRDWNRFYSVYRRLRALVKSMEADAVRNLSTESPPPKNGGTDA